MSNKRHFSGLPIYGEPAFVPTRPDNQSGTKCLQLEDAIGAVNSSLNTEEGLRRQINVIQQLQRIYKASAQQEKKCRRIISDLIMPQVEQYALLEELRMKHIGFTKDGKHALMDSTCTTAAWERTAGADVTTLLPMSMHDSMCAKRAKVSPPTPEGIQLKVEVGIVGTSAAPVSPQPAAPPAIATAALPRDLHSSPAGGGVSLNNWMPHQTSAAAGNTAQNNTPQSSRHAPTELARTCPTPAASNPSSAAPQPPSASPRYGDPVLGYGSDAEDDPGQFTDIEDDLIAGKLQPAPTGVNADAVGAWRARFAANAEEVGLRFLNSKHGDKHSLLCGGYHSCGENVFDHKFNFASVQQPEGVQVT